MKKRNILVICLILVMLVCSACGKTTATDVEVSDEVTKALMASDEEGSESGDDKTSNSSDNGLLGLGDESKQTTSDVGESKKSNQDSLDDKSNTESTDNNQEKTNTSDDASTKTGIVYGKNPFLGYNSTSTKYNIKYSINTDSGIAGIAWGFTDDENAKVSSTGNRITGKATKTPGSDFYVAGIDLTGDEFPKFYLSRRQIDPKDGSEMILEEQTQNLDIMYTRNSEYIGQMHFVELQIDGTNIQVILDSVPVMSATLHDSRPIGQIGTYVTIGDYHADFDDLKVLEGVNGDGEYLYVEDFSGKTNIFSPYLKTKNGILNAKSGLYMVHRE